MRRRPSFRYTVDIRKAAQIVNVPSLVSVWSCTPTLARRGWYALGHMGQTMAFTAQNAVAQRLVLAGGSAAPPTPLAGLLSSGQVAQRPAPILGPDVACWDATRCRARARAGTTGPEPRLRSARVQGQCLRVQGRVADVCPGVGALLTATEVAFGSALLASGWPRCGGSRRSYVHEGRLSPAACLRGHRMTRPG